MTAEDGEEGIWLKMTSAFLLNLPFLLILKKSELEFQRYISFHVHAINDK